MSSVKTCIQSNSSVNTESQNDNVSKILEVMSTFQNFLFQGTTF